MPVDRATWRLIGILGVIVAAFVFVGIVPAAIERSRLNARIAAAEAELDSGEAGEAELRRLRRDVADLRAKVDQPQRRVPAEDELSEVLRNLTESAAAPGVAVHEIVVDEPHHHRDYSAIPVRMAFDASFPEAFSILQRLESMSRLVRFDDLAARIDPDAARAPVAVTLELSAFYAPEAAGGAE